jgi:hypothetical protein
MIAAAKLVDGDARAARKNLRRRLRRAPQEGVRKIANAQFKTSGGATYPDPTSTLRLSYGVVKGYEENGEHIPAMTTFAGLFIRSAEHENRPPFDIPGRWLKKKAELNLDTPFDFVHTADIIAANSGSPVVNRAGELVGMIFDGNQQGIPWDYAFDDREGRGIAVGSEAIIEALRKVYGADDLVKELLGNH